MKALTTISSCILLSITITACDTYKPSNLLKDYSFEEFGKDKEIASFWRTEQHAGIKAYNMDIDSNISSNGQQSFKIEQYGKQVYGMISQRVDMPSNRDNKKFVFTAMLKTQNIAEDSNGWRLVVNCVAENNHIIKQYQSTTMTGTTDWEKFTLEELIPEGTIKIEAGVLLQSIGIGWIDEASLIVDPIQTPPKN